MMKLLRIFCFTTLGIYIGLSSAFAQTEQTVQTTQTTQTVQSGSTATSVAQPARQETVQSLNFEDELVEGTAQKPEFFYLFQQKNFNYKRLIKLRENFLPEMQRTSEDVQRLRGGR